MTVDEALAAALWSIQQRPNIVSAKLRRYWKYTDARGEPQFVAARYDVVKRKEGGKTEPGKEFFPVRRDGNGWRVGLGEWGKRGKLCPLYGLAAISKAISGNANLPIGGAIKKYRVE